MTDPTAAHRRIARLRAQIVDLRSDLARLRSLLRAEQAALAASEAQEAGRKASRSAGARKPATRPRASQAPGRDMKGTTP